MNENINTVSDDIVRTLGRVIIPVGRVFHDRNPGSEKLTGEAGAEAAIVVDDQIVRFRVVFPVDGAAQSQIAIKQALEAVSDSMKFFPETAGPKITPSRSVPNTSVGKPEPAQTAAPAASPAKPAQAAAPAARPTVNVTGSVPAAPKRPGRPPRAAATAPAPAPAPASEPDDRGFHPDGADPSDPSEPGDDGVDEVNDPKNYVCRYGRKYAGRTLGDILGADLAGRPTIEFFATSDQMDMTNPAFDSATLREKARALLASIS